MFFDPIKKFDKEIEMKRAEREVEIYRQRKMLEVDQAVESYRREEYRKVEEVVVEGNRQTAEYEHTFHMGMETKNVALAKLDAQIESKKETLARIGELDKLREERAHYKGLSEAKDITISGKDKTIELLNENIKVIVGRLSKMDIGALTLNVPQKEASKE